MTYKFNRQDNSFFYLPFDSYQNAIDFANNIEELQIEEVPNFTTIPSYDKLESDKTFLLFLLQIIKLDIRKINNKTTRLTVINKLKATKEIMSFGDLEIVRDLIAGVVTGAVFTQAVKDKYLGLIDEYLNII